MLSQVHMAMLEELAVLYDVRVSTEECWSIESLDTKILDLKVFSISAIGRRK